MRQPAWLELRLNGGILKWSNAVDWARVDLVKDGLLMRATDVPGSGYQLVTGAEHMVQKHLREQEVQALRARDEQADGSPKKKRKRVEAEVEDCNAIYIMFDRSGPTAARSERVTATAQRAKLRRDLDGRRSQTRSRRAHRIGLCPEGRDLARKQLGFKGHRVNGEWVHCKWSLAVPILQALGSRRVSIGALVAIVG